MRQNIKIPYDLYADSIASFLKFEKDSNNLDFQISNKKKSLIKFIYKILENNLTARQRFCFWNFYVEKRSLKKISQKLQIHESTVSRHVSAAKKKICNNIKCFYGSEINF